MPEDEFTRAITSTPGQRPAEMLETIAKNRNCVTVQSGRPPRLGLRENLGQFSLLVLINAFVGAMVGLERTVLPLLAESEFGLTSKTVILSFIVSFGITKALTNLFAGFFSDRYGRKVFLVLGWIFGIPVPFLIMFGSSWNWIFFANILLGINQGLCWSTTVVMKIDLVGPKRRGLAMGLNEFAGYLAVALAAVGSGYIAARYGLRPEPFYLGVGFVAMGLFLSSVFVHDTRTHVSLETHEIQIENRKSFRDIFAITTWRNRNLFSCSQAGLVNNLNDGMVWGLLPIFLASFSVNVGQIGQLAAIYPAVWGLLQIYTGSLSDRVGRKSMITTGMWVQGAGILMLALSNHYAGWITGLVLLGIGTAQVYPTLLAAIGDDANPVWRATSVGVYRFWRDSGYAIGALTSGIVADLFGLVPAFLVIAGITFLSGAIAQVFLSKNSTSISLGG